MRDEVGTGTLSLLALSLIAAFTLLFALSSLPPALAATANIDLGSFSISTPRVIVNYTAPVRIVYASLAYKGQTPVIYNTLCTTPDPAAGFSMDYALTPLKDGGSTAGCAGAAVALQPGPYEFTISASDTGSSSALPVPDQRTFTLLGMEITMVSPGFGVGDRAPMQVRLRTHELINGIDTPRSAQCKYDDSTIVVDSNLEQSYGRLRKMADRDGNGYNHNFTFGKGKLQILCKEPSGRITPAYFILDADPSPPRFSNLSVQPQPVVDAARKRASVSFETDDNSTCAIRQTGPGSGLAQSFPTEDENARDSYARRHEAVLSYDDIVGEEQHDFNYTIACRNLAGLVSTTDIKVVVKLGGAVTVISPGPVTNKRPFTLMARATFIPSSCTANGVQMARTADDASVFAADFSRPDGRYSFAITCASGEDAASTTYEVTVDSVAPAPPRVEVDNVICDGKLRARIISLDNGSLAGYDIAVVDNNGWRHNASGLQNVVEVPVPSNLGDEVTWSVSALDLAGNTGVPNVTRLTDMHPGEDEECGGPAFITMRRPSAMGFAPQCDGGQANPCRYTVEIATLRPSACVYEPEDGSDAWSAAIPFGSGDGLVHTKRVFFDNRRIRVNCTELANHKSHTRIFLIGYDLSAPVINVEVLPGTNVVDRTNAILTVTATTDDLAYCYFDSKPFDDTSDTDQFAYTQSHLLTPPLDLRNTPEGAKTYRVTCKNLAGLSSATDVNTVIDYHARLRIDVLSPPGFGAENAVVLKVKPNKQSACSYRKNSTAAPLALAESAGVHSADLGSFSDGSYSYLVTCTAAAEGERATINVAFTIDTRTPSIKSIDGKTTLCEGEDVTYTVAASDIDGSPIVEYSFQNMTRNATRGAFTLRTRNLGAGSYEASVAVINRAGLRSAQETIGFDVLNSSDDACSLDAGHCSNGRKDTGERSIDCGGTCAKRCVSCSGDAECGENICVEDICIEPAADCRSDDDCDTGLACDAGVCIGDGTGDTGDPTDRCADGELDGDETDVDCGGSCAQCVSCDDATPCADGGVCNGNGVCVPGARISCFDGQQNGDEEGVDCGGSCIEECGTVPPIDDHTCSDYVQNGDEEGVDCGGSCLDSCDGGTTPGKSHLLSILFIALGLAVMGGAGYYLYEQNEGKRLAAQAARASAAARPSMPARTAPIQPLNPALAQKYEQERVAREAQLREAYAKRAAEKESQRKALFEPFAAQQPGTPAATAPATTPVAENDGTTSDTRDTSDATDSAGDKAEAGSKAQGKEAGSKTDAKRSGNPENAFEALDKIGK